MQERRKVRDRKECTSKKMHAINTSKNQGVREKGFKAINTRKKKSKR